LKNIKQDIQKRIIFPLFLIFAAIQRVNPDPIPILVFPFDGAEPVENSSLSELLANTIRQDEKYSPQLQTQAPEMPDIPPSPVGSVQYGITTMLYPDVEETHAQIWLWDLEGERLIMTDEMVYTGPEDATELIPALVSWLLSRIPQPPASAAASVAEAAPVEEASPVEEPSPGQTAASGQGQDSPPAGEPPPGQTAASGQGQDSPPVEEPSLEAEQEPSPEAAPEGKPSRNREKQPVYSYISPEYIPQFPVYGSKNAFFMTRIRPVGAGLRFSVLPINLPWGAIGFELSSFWNYLSVHYDLFNSTSAVFNLVYQLPLGNRNFSFNFRAGGGVTAIIDLQFVYTDGTSSRQTPETISIMPLASGGFSFRALITKRFFAEIGAEFAHTFAADSPMGNLRAHLGVGWKLGGNSRGPAH
jgi:hypothetical protein